ncbi:hypothetical protein MmTuc01_2431 [Methanosarcina mazei Tuc01]|uniref:Uncharacterized protein n=1 Tax=Methanosarcina mazei Tuc01 TaxID=1236903 RepID=M1PZG5_METMZ|nr:hypothetical protein MmTuc01_2431 [Methanosarcina mazei Tuc01]
MIIDPLELFIVIITGILGSSTIAYYFSRFPGLTLIFI